MRFILIALITVISSCNNGSNDASSRLEREMKKHLDPQDSIVNKMELNKTFALQSSETQGVNNERYKEFDYWKEIDKEFFQYVEAKEFSNSNEAGGSSTTPEIYKAIKKGTTEVRFYKKHYYGNHNPADSSIVKDTTSYLYNTYKFSIE